MEKRELVDSKILNLEGLKRMLAYWKFKGMKVSLAYGTFDVLKPGTLDMLFQAANKGSVLLVAIKPDSIVEKHKGEGHPVYSQCNRALAVASLQVVSSVYILEEEDPKDFIDMVKPVSVACCLQAASIEVDAFNRVLDWGGEFIRVDTGRPILPKNENQINCG
jgi:bifunctional ADP-heptose synthase (sugar kinase/adenylyltransferase)